MTTGKDQPAACPDIACHGNPFRYCACGWMEELCGKPFDGIPVSCTQPKDHEGDHKAVVGWKPA